MDGQPLIFLHLKLVARISVAVGAVAVSSLLAALLLLPVSVEETYEAIIRSRSVTREQLEGLMLVIGLALVATAAVITWLITLYSSFRVAGPLHRFGRNLKLASLDDEAELVSLRRGDALHPQQENIRQAVGALRVHLQAVQQSAAQAREALAAGDARAYAVAVTRLRELDEKIRA